jgi:hypothetical protein
MPRPNDRLLGATPLTDPGSLAGSVLFHLAFVALASFTVLSASLPLVSRENTRPLLADVGPVDNRATNSPESLGQGGGSPGEMGGMGSLPFIGTDGTVAPGVSRDPVADTLLAEILPATNRPAEIPQRDLPGPQTIGQGLIPGSGSGGGGGAGGGSGGGVGRGIGPGTQFFGAREHAHSFAYVIDCSGSMATRNSLGVAKRELLASLGQLPPDAQFSVIFYNLQARMLADPQGRRGLMAATDSNKTRVEGQLATVNPDGGTDHMLALRTALALRPEVVFFLTDADMMSNGDVNDILKEVGSTRIQAVEFGRGTPLGQRTPLGRLATTTGGRYQYIDVSHFPRTSAGY